MSLAFGDLEQKACIHLLFPFLTKKTYSHFLLAFVFLTEKKKKILISVFPWPPAGPWWILPWTLRSLCRTMVLFAWSPHPHPPGLVLPSPSNCCGQRPP